MPINAAIYVGGPIMPGYAGPPANSSDLINDIASSGFTTVVCYTLWIEEAGGDFQDGDLSFNFLPVAGEGSSKAIVSNGVYQGPSTWSGQLSQLLEAGSGVTSIFFSTLGKFSRIQSLIAKYGTGSDSPLYKNFAALKAALPIDGIDLDDEDLWDASVTAPFAQMLYGLGYKITFCPYLDSLATYWASCLVATNTTADPDIVSGFNLQTYGDADPGTYIDAIVTATKWTSAQATAFITTGFYCLRWEHEHKTCTGTTPTGISGQYETWKKAGITGLQGGFVFILDSLVNAESTNTCSGPNMQAYAASLLAAPQA